MPTCRAQVILRTSDNVIENFVTNSWAFDVPSYSGAGAVLTPILTTFYNALRPYMSPLMGQNNHLIKYSGLPGSPPNYPFDEDTFNLTTAPAGTALPEELSVALSFQGTRQAGFPQARRRGRIYLGTFNTSVFTGNRPATTFTNAMVAAAQALKGSVTAAGAGFGWVVWSSADGAAVPVNNGWIDNAFDVQRRRGVDPTARTTFT